MKTKTKIQLGILGLLLLLPTQVFAQGPGVGNAPTGEFTVVDKYDIDSTSFTYCVTGPTRPGSGSISTSGASTTTTGDALALLDTKLNVGDQIFVSNSSTGLLTRFVSAVASETSITIEARGGTDTWTLAAGTQWRYANVVCGTGATNGWFNISQFLNHPGGTVSITVQVDQAVTDGTGIDIRWEAKTAGANTAAVQICPVTNGTVTTVTDANVGINGRYTCVMDYTFDQARVGVKLTTADDGAGDATTNREQINIYVSGR